MKAKITKEIKKEFNFKSDEFRAIIFSNKEIKISTNYGNIGSIYFLEKNLDELFDLVMEMKKELESEK